MISLLGARRICCSQSQTFSRLLAQHQNIQWAFKNIAPYSTQYASAVDELMKLMQLFVAKVKEFISSPSFKVIFFSFYCRENEPLN